MKSSKLLYFVLFIAAGIVITAVSINTVFATNSITTIFASPANTFAGKGTQYVIKFDAIDTTSTVGSIKITFPSGTTTGNAQIAELTGFPGATFTSSGSSNVFTINISPATKPTNPVFIFLAKVGNTATSGGPSLTVTTYPSSNGVGTPIDSGTASFTIANNLGGVLYLNDTTSNVGIGTSTPQKKLDVKGDVQVSGYIYSTNSSSLKIIPSNGGSVCIGTGC